MKLLIPKDKAIQILQDRISGLYAYDFNAEAQKERTVLDLKEIFPLVQTQYLKIQFLRFDTYVVADKHRVMLEAQKTAEQVLKSYIEFISVYSKVTEERKVIKEKYFESKYYCWLPIFSTYLKQTLFFNLFIICLLQIFQPVNHRTYSSKGIMWSFRIIIPYPFICQLSYFVYTLKKVCIKYTLPSSTFVLLRYICAKLKLCAF